MKLLSFILITRPLNFIITFLVVITAAHISSEKIDNFFIIFLAAISAGLTASAGNIINDLFDIESDKLNHPERVLPSGKISKKEALFLYIFFLAFSISISIFVNLLSFLILLISHLILFYYSYKLKAIPFLSNIIIAFLTGMVFIYGGISTGKIYPVIIPSVFAFMINLIRELIKDMQDSEGDKKNNIKTVPVLYGKNFAKKIILFLTIILILITIIPFTISYYKIEYFILVMIIVNPFLVYCLKILFDNDSGQNLKKISYILKLDMIFGLTAIFIGA